MVVREDLGKHVTPYLTVPVKEYTALENILESKFVEQLRSKILVRNQQVWFRAEVLLFRWQMDVVSWFARYQHNIDHIKYYTITHCLSFPSTL